MTLTPRRLVTLAAAVALGAATTACSAAPAPAPQPNGSAPPTTAPRTGGPTLPLAGTFVAAASSGVSGIVNVVLQPSDAKLCWVIVASGLHDVTKAQIVASTAATGPFALGTPSASGKGSGCSHAPAALVSGLVGRPQDYRVTIDEKAFPAGAANASLAVDKSL